MYQTECIIRFLDYLYKDDFKFDHDCRRWIAGAHKSPPYAHVAYYEIIYISDSNCSLPVMEILYKYFNLHSFVLKKILLKWIKNKIKNHQ